MATAEKLPETAAAKRMFKALGRDAVKLRESVNNQWRAVVSREISRQALLASDLWSVVSADFAPFDKIAVVREDRAFFAELLVLDSGRGYAHLVELSFHELPSMTTAATDLPPGHEIFHGGPEKLYCVRRIRDGVMLGTGFPSRKEALEHLLEHASLQ